MQLPDKDQTVVEEIRVAVNHIMAQHNVGQLVDSLSRAVKDTLHEQTDERHLPSFALPADCDGAIAILKPLREQLRNYAHTLDAMQPAPPLAQTLTDTIETMDACFAEIDYLQYCASASRDLALSNEQIEEAQNLIEKMKKRVAQDERKLDVSTLSHDNKQAIAFLKASRETAQGYVNKLLRNIKYDAVAKLSAFAAERIETCDAVLATYKAIPKVAMLPLAAGSLALGIVALGRPYPFLLGACATTAAGLGLFVLMQKPTTRSRRLAIAGLLCGCLALMLLGLRFLASPQQTEPQRTVPEMETPQTDLLWLQTINNEPPPPTD